MKNLLRLVSGLALAAGSLYAFESAQLSLDTPLLLEKDEATFAIRHRFNGDVEDADTFFGMDDGANIMLQLRYLPMKHVFVKAEHTRTNSDYTLGGGVAYDFGFLSAQAGLDWFTFKPGIPDRREGAFGNVALQTPHYFDKVQFTLNGGYDSYYEISGMGIGVDLMFQNFIPSLSYTESISLMAEYYPVVDELDGVTGDDDSYAIGLRFRTFAHHFEILVSNSTALEPQTMMRGTNDDILHFGFNINRKF